VPLQVECAWESVGVEQGVQLVPHELVLLFERHALPQGWNVALQEERKHVPCDASHFPLPFGYWAVQLILPAGPQFVSPCAKQFDPLA
jgi:hypothetical protein